MRLKLKIKIKSLVAEVDIIRAEEAKQQRYAASERCSSEHAEQHWDVIYSLRAHRKGIVRGETRNSLLAYGFLKGLPYKRMEQTTREDNKPNWDEIEKLALRFGGWDKRTLKQRFAEWKEEALKE